MSNTDLLFIYGRTPHLARYEARTVYPAAIFDEITPECDWVHGLDIPAGIIMDRLGGIVRVAKECRVIQDITREEVTSIFLEDLRQKKQINFIISTIGSVHIPPTLARQIKEELHKLDITARYIMPSGDHVASAAQVDKQGVSEYLFVAVPRGILVAKTLAVQDSSGWSHRDYERPVADAKRGMLPLKVARMVVNIALGPTGEGKVCADPFCGMGTIPAEGWMLGSKWYASDVSIEAAEATNRNLRWLSGQYNKNSPVPETFVCDAVHLSEKIPNLTLDAIVTEPFLGNPALGEGKITDRREIANILKGLEKLYIGCLKEWHSLLKVSGRVIIALPVIKRGEHKETVKKLIDSCEILGYSIEAGPYTYSRPDAVVQRNFYIFKKK